jgi:hypothetical protein
MISFLKANWLNLSFVSLATLVTMASLYGALVTQDNGLRFIFLAISTVAVFSTFETLYSMKWSTNGSTTKV